ncbi:conserved hypothetical protein [Tenacibaculum sp. 190524A05c]|uniref:hypothetical protein n=1 Tax=Tenacibaculum platacis TaxID=3137852 RepID=UPI0031FA806A
MTYSEIKIKFNVDLIEGSVVSFKIENKLFPGKPKIELKETWVNLRSSSNQATVGSSASLIGGVSATNYLAAFNLDYNSTSLYVSSIHNNEVTIKCTNPYIEFSEGTAYEPNGEFLNLIDVRFTYNNFTGSVLELQQYEFIQSSSPCTHVRLRVTLNDVPSQINSPVSIQNNTSNPIELDILRGTSLISNSILFECQDTNGMKVSENIDVPNSLNTENLSITVNNSPNGATVIFNLSSSFGLSLEYSLDNQNWKTQNVFDSLLPGDYIVYVRDQFGCSISKTFMVEEFDVTNPYDKLCKTNSIRFVRDKINGVLTDKNIFENRLSTEDKVDLVYKEIQHFKNTDVITTQFKTNYSDIQVEVVANSIDIIPISKKSNNLRLKDSREALQFNYGNGKTGIYFVSGKKFDFDTGIYTDEDYLLNGSLPEWARVGQYLKIENAWFEIENIIPSSEKRAEVLVINRVYSGAESIVTVGSIYNREDYDIYEFSIVMSDYNDSNFYVTISLKNDGFPDVEYKSEEINVSSDLNSLSEIIYSNDTNTAINYSTGIEHKLWVELDNCSQIFNADSETHKSDNKTILTNGDVTEGIEIKTLPITRGFLVKLFLSLYHRNFYLNGTKYVLSEKPEVEGRLDDTNLYVLTARLIKANEIYKSKTYDVSVPITGELIELPSLVSTDVEGNFFKI